MQNANEKFEGMWPLETRSISLLGRALEVLLPEKGDVLKVSYPWAALSYMEGVFQAEAFNQSIAATAQISPSVIMRGSIWVEEGAIIKDYTVIEGPVYIGKNSIIGPHNVLRGPLNIEQEVKTGAFCELKNSIIQQGTHFHSGYVGDSVVGRNCRFGAGFISANKRLDRQEVHSIIGSEKIGTGRVAFGFACGDEAAFGIQSGTMPGVLIGSGAKIGPGVRVFENIPNNEVVRS